MIPIADVIPTRRTPAVTRTLTGLTALAFVSAWAAGAIASWTHRFGVVPVDLDMWRVLPSLFVHAGALHCGLCLWFLWIFGDNVEDRLGRVRFSVVYVLSAVTAAVVQAALATGSAEPIVGAAGAVAGVMGAYFVLYPTSKVLLLVPLPLSIVEAPAILLLGAWVAVQFLDDAGVMALVTKAGVGGGLSLAAQAAAFAAGALMALVLRRPVAW